MMEQALNTDDSCIHGRGILDWLKEHVKIFQPFHDTMDAKNQNLLPKLLQSLHFVLYSSLLIFLFFSPLPTVYQTYKYSKHNLTQNLQVLITCIDSLFQKRSLNRQPLVGWCKWLQLAL